MKKKNGWMGIAITGFLMLTKVYAQGQGYGLQVAESVEPRDKQYVDLTFGAVVSEDDRFIGVREAFPVLNSLRFFMDVGVADPDDQGNEVAGQIGGVYDFPFDLPVDTGVRVAFYRMDGTETEVLGGNLLLLGSREEFFEGLFFYGGLGLDVNNRQGHYVDDSYEVVTGEDPLTTETRDVLVKEGNANTELNPMLTLGVLMPCSWISDRVFVYMEATVLDDIFFGLGLRYR